MNPFLQFVFDFIASCVGLGFCLGAFLVLVVSGLVSVFHVFVSMTKA